MMQGDHVKLTSRVVMAKAAFTSKLDLNLRKYTSKVLHLEHNFVCC